MSTTRRIKKPCGVCAAQIAVEVQASSFDDGRRDLDLRPCGLGRHDLLLLVQCCTACGYCTHDVLAPLLGAPAYERLGSKLYRQTLGVPLAGIWKRLLGSGAPRAPLARTRCAAMLYEAEGNLSGAGRANLHVAWLLDDTKDERGEREARLKAVNLWRRAAAAGRSFCEDPAAEAALPADLLRRAGGEGTSAEAICEEASEWIDHPGLLQMLAFQANACCRSDARTYTFEAVFGDG